MHDQETVLGDCFADDGEIKVPFVEHGFGFGLKLGAQNHQHAFLGFGQHHFVGGHVEFAGWHFFKVQTHTKVALVAHFNRGTGQARGTHILDRDHGTGGHQFKRGFHQALFGEGVTDLHCGAFVFDRVVKFGRCHCGTANTVAAGFRTKVHNGHADAGGCGVENLVCVGQTGGKCVHKAVAVIGRVKADFAANGRHAKAVAVAANACDHTVHQLARLVVIGRPEAERVHGCDGTGTHCKDIAQNAANAGRRTLIGFDIRRVVVAFHLEDQRLTVTDINDARVFAGAANDLRSFGGQGAQPFLGRLIGTMFVPHRREDPKLGKGGFAPDDIQKTFVFVVIDPVAGDKVWRDGWFGHGADIPLADMAVLLE